MTTSPAGWYPAPDDATLWRWFDGEHWTAQTAPNVAVGARRSLGGGWFVLATVLQVALAGAAVVNLFGLAVGVWTARLMGTWLTDPASADVATGQLIDNLRIAAPVAQSLMLVVAGVLFIVWLYRAHRSDRMTRSVLDHGSGWAIGGWFVPILAFWRPLQMIQDVRRGATGSRSLTNSATTYVWWALLVTSVLTGRVAFALAPGADVPDDEVISALQSSGIADAVDGGVTAVAAVLALVVVRQVTRLVRNSGTGHRTQPS